MARTWRSRASWASNVARIYLSRFSWCIVHRALDLWLAAKVVARASAHGRERLGERERGSDSSIENKHKQNTTNEHYMSRMVQNKS